MDKVVDTVEKLEVTIRNPEKRPLLEDLESAGFCQVIQRSTNKIRVTETK